MMDMLRDLDVDAAGALAFRISKLLCDEDVNNGTRLVGLALAAASLGAQSPSPERYMSVFGEALARAMTIATDGKVVPS